MASTRPLTGWRDLPLRWAALPLAVLALVAAVMAAASGTGSGTAVVRRGPASVVFTAAGTLLALGLAASTIAAIVTLTRLGAARHAGEPRERERWRMVKATAATMGFLFLLFLLGRLRRVGRPAPLRPGTLPGPTGRSGSSALHFVPAASIVTLAVVAVLVLAAVAGPVVHRLRLARHPRSWAGGSPPSRTGGTSELVLADSLARSLVALEVPDATRERDPRRAVVAAYLQMEAAAAAAGAARAPDETAEEYLGRLLCVLGISPKPAARLTSVFERARYAQRPVTEADREQALAALGEVQLELRSSLRSADETGPVGAGR